MTMTSLSKDYMNHPVAREAYTYAKMSCQPGTPFQSIFVRDLCELRWGIHLTPDQRVPAYETWGYMKAFVELGGVTSEKGLLHHRDRVGIGALRVRFAPKSYKDVLINGEWLSPSRIIELMEEWGLGAPFGFVATARASSYRDGVESARSRNTTYPLTEPLWDAVRTLYDRLPASIKC